VVDLLKQRHEDGRRFAPTEFIEEGPRIAVGLTVSDARWAGETAEVFKVFTFREADDQAVLLQDTAGREHALEMLSAG
jgi:hypothetical protein